MAPRASWFVSLFRLVPLCPSFGGPGGVGGWAAAGFPGWWWGGGGGVWDNTPRRMENCVVKLDRYLAVCSGQAQTPKVLVVTYTHTREVSKPKLRRKPGGIDADKAGGISGKGGRRADKVGEASVNIAGGK